jgi:hypothetical protein
MLCATDLFPNIFSRRRTMNTRKFRPFGPQLTAIAASLLVSAAAFAAGPVSGPAGPANAPAKKTLSAAQLAEAQARVNLANQIVQNVTADALANGATDSWRLSLLTNLYNTPSSALQNIRGSANTLGKVQEMAATARAQAAANAAPAAGGASAASGAGPTSSTDGLGSTTDSLVFTPMTPCRFIDTRNIGTPIGTAATHLHPAKHWRTGHRGQCHRRQSECGTGLYQRPPGRQHAEYQLHQLVPERRYGAGGKRRHHRHCADRRPLQIRNVNRRRHR